MKRKFIRYGREYTVTEVRAKANCDQDYRDALLITGKNIDHVWMFGMEEATFVIFGYGMPETDSEFEVIVKDVNAWKNSNSGNYTVQLRKERWEK